MEKFTNPKRGHALVGGIRTPLQYLTTTNEHLLSLLLGTLLILSAVGLQAQTYNFSSATTIGNLASFTAPGGRSTPAMVDLNADGKWDFVAGNANGTFTYYQNIGTAKYSPATPGTPIWNTLTNPFAGLDAGSFSTPTFADIDDDGDQDLFSGDNLGRFHYYKNTGGVFTEQFGVNNPLGQDENNAIYTVGANSTVGFLDTDGDGDLDAVVGNANGQFRHLENEGDENNAYFPRYTDAEAGTLGVQLFTTLNGEDVPRVLTGGELNATVCPVDMNCDGIFTFVSGTRGGSFQFRQVNQANGNFSHPAANHPLDGEDISAAISEFSYPTFGDLDGDGDQDAISGKADGKFVYFQNNTCALPPTFSPLIVCGSSADITLDATNNFTDHVLVAADFGSPTATSACGNTASLTFSPDLLTCANVGIPLTVTLQAVDNFTGVKSSSTSCLVTITARDETDPLAACKPFYDIEVGDNNVTLGMVPITFVEDGSSDNCTNSVNLTKSISYNYSNTVPFSCADAGTVPVNPSPNPPGFAGYPGTGYAIRMVATDASGNTDECFTEVRIIDTKGPVPDVTSLPALTRELCNYDAASGTFLSTFEIPGPTATDHCDGQATAVRVKVNGGPEVPFLGAIMDWDLMAIPTDFAVGTYTLTWIYEDAATPTPNVSSQTQTLTITSAKLQFASCPSMDIEINPASPPTSCVGSTVPQGTNPGTEVDWAALDLIGNVTLCGNPPTPTVTITKTHTAASVFPYGTTTVFYSAKDGAGNVGNCSFKVVVRDPVTDLAISHPTVYVNTTVTPSVNIPVGNFIYSNYANPAIVYGGSGIYVLDNGGTDCGRNVSWVGLPTVTNPQHPCAGPYSVKVVVASSPNNFYAPGTTVTSGSFFPIGTTYLNFVATDSKGNTYVVADFYITVDDISPVITCPQPTITVNTPANACQVNVTIPNAVASDNCPGVAIEYSLDGGFNYFPQPFGTNSFQALYTPGYVNTPTSIIFRANDGNTTPATCTVNVFVKDTQKPVFNNCPSNAVVTTDLSFPGCGEYYPGSWIDPYVTDNAGYCSFDVDSVSVIITHPDFSPLVVDDIVAGIDIGFGAEFNNSGSTNRTAEHVFNEGTSTVTYIATDLAGNTGSCQFTVSVRDNIAPNVFCPLQPVVVSTEANCRDSIEIGLYDDGINALDIAPDAGLCGTPTVTYRLPNSLVTLPPSTTFGLGFHTLVAVATDRSGNTSTCSFQIEVKDLNAPMMSNCPNDITVEDTDGGCGQVVTWAGPTFQDDCTAGNALSITRLPNMPSGSLFPVGTTSMFIYAKDANDNISAGCSFDVTVLDKTKPVIVCPGNILKQITNNDPLQCNALIDFKVTATDDCAGAGGYVYVYTLVGPYDYQLRPQPGDPDLEAEVSFTSLSFPVAPATTLSFIAGDQAGNTATCSFTITVEDKQGPEIYDCPGNQVLNTANCAGTTAFWTAPSSISEACSPFTYSLTGPNVASGSNFAPGTTPVKYIATDNIGNTRECSFNITVKEGVAPTFNNLPNQNFTPCNGYDVFIPATDCFGNGVLSSLSQLTAPTASDNCTPFTAPVTLFTALTLPVNISGVLSIQWVATDASGNTSLCDQDIFPVDEVAPIIECPPAITLNTTPSGNCSVPVLTYSLTTASASAIDNCDGTLSQNPFAGEIYNNAGLLGIAGSLSVGMYSVQWTAEDNNGNTSTCNQSVTVQDGVAPLIACPANITVTASQPTCTINNTVGFLGSPVFSDNCGGPSVTNNAGSSFGLGITTVVHTVKDAGGNTASCAQTVTVNCSGSCTPTTPTFSGGSNCGNTTPFVLANVNCPTTVTVTAAQLGLAATDNCGNALTIPAKTINVSITGTQTVTFTATVGANTANCTRTVSVTCNPVGPCTPNAAPTLAGCGGTIPVNANASCLGTVANFGVTASDNCGSVSVSPNNSGPYTLGNTTVTFTATNGIGSTSCVKTVVVSDVTDPSFISCPQDVTIEAEAGEEFALSVNLEIPIGNDNCSVASIEQAVGTPEMLFGDGEVVTWILTDGGGNTAECQQNITVFIPGSGPSGCADALGMEIADDGAAGDLFGYSVDVDGSRAIVGAPYDDNGKGVNSGAAYIFEKNGLGDWVQVAKLVVPDGDAADLFGESVAIDGNTIIIGASKYAGKGAAFIFSDSGASWPLVAKLLASDGLANDDFGVSVDISGDFAIVGAPNDDAPKVNQGSVYIFGKNTGGANNWGQVTKKLANDFDTNDNYGISVGIDGNVAVVGARYDDDLGTNSGSAYVLDGGSAWSEIQKLTPADGAAGDYFGSSVAISGIHIIVGSYLDDYGAFNNAGSAYIFEEGGLSWTEIAKLVPLDPAAADQFGISVSIESGIAVVGSHFDDDMGTNSGSAYVFTEASGWSQVNKLTGSSVTTNDNFGRSVGIGGSSIVIGAYKDDISGLDQGSAYFFGCSNAAPLRPEAKERTAVTTTTGGQVRCFPNPSTDMVNIDITLAEEENVQVVVSDLSGKVISTLFDNKMSGENRLQWEGKQFGNGMYLIRIQSASLREVVPVVIVR